jgi:uncharacterized protein (TIGR03435 family)
MGRIRTCLNLLVISSGALFSQPATPAPKFLMADVHPAAPSPNAFLRVGLYKGGRYEIHNATILDLVRTAYGVDPDKVLPGESLSARDLLKDRFDVFAAVPPDLTPDALKLMLQALLAERFSLVAHHDTKPVPAYVITAGPKPLLQTADGSGDTGCKIQSNTTEDPQPGAGSNIVRANFNGTPVQLNLNEPFPFACRNITMAAFAQSLRAMLGAQAYIANTPVVDQTNLAGKWNFEIKWTYRNPQASPPPNVTTIFDGFEKLGLKMELLKSPFPVIVVDSVSPTPTPNLPGVTEKMAPPPPRFEVADFRPSVPFPNTGQPPGAGRGGLMFQAMNRVGMQGETLSSLIAAAWNLASPESIIGLPKALDGARFDIDGLLPTPETMPGFGPPGGQGIDMDGARLMLRTLLQERFKLEAHLESRPVPSGEFTVSRPGVLKAANPAGRPGCLEGPGDDGKDPRKTNPAATRLLTCRNMTVAEFALQLKNRAGGYLGQSPAPYDATGLPGKYDFTINFSLVGLTAAGAITLEEALDQQLGLKLGTGNHPGTALVIDHCEEKPLPE